jgi:hypothetical protein
LILTVSGSISGTGGMATVLKGVGRFGIPHHFRLGAVNGVCLRSDVDEDSHDGSAVPIVRVEGVGFCHDFGARLPEDQRVFIALFLLRKRAERDLSAQAGAA